jgi:hypothetical protein
MSPAKKRWLGTLRCSTRPHILALCFKYMEMKKEMKRLVCIFCACISLTGCIFDNYGYTSNEWESLTQEERDQIKAEAQENLIKEKEEQRLKEFLNTPIKKTLGSRSNVF